MIRWSLPSSLLIAGLLAACGDAPVAPASIGIPASIVHAHSPDHSGEQNVVNATIRRATARYQRIAAALEDGYAPVSECVPGMGVHYLREDDVDGIVDPARPEVLVYEPQKNGRPNLVAVEFIVPAEAWDPFNTGPPLLGSHPFDDHRPPGSGGPPFPHYQLHAWVWKHNPAGIYTPFNPNVTCEHAG
jgi:hypothetical protein